MNYQKFSENIHILTNNLDRKKTEVEIIWTAGGSFFEQESDRGRKHLMEHCIASRTKDMDFKAFQDFQFRESLMLNAYTGPLTMGMEASGHSQDFEKLLDIALETAFTPTFDQTILDQEKEIVLREISERRGDPNYRLHFEVMNQIFTKESYEVHQTLGDSQTVAIGQLEDFTRLHLENLKTSPVLICCYGGGVKTDLIQTKLQKILDQKNLQINNLLETKNKKPINYSIGSQFQDFQKKAVISELAHKHCEINLYIPFKTTFENRPATKIFEELYLKFYGRVYDKLRNQLGLIYSLHGSFESSINCLYINLACEIEHIEKILTEIKATFSNFEENFDQQKLNELKNVIIKKVEMTMDSPSNSINMTKSILTKYNIPETLEEYEQKLKKVSKNEIKKIYNQIQNNFKNSKLVLVSKNPKIQEVLDSYEI